MEGVKIKFLNQIRRLSRMIGMIFRGVTVSEISITFTYHAQDSRKAV